MWTEEKIQRMIEDKIQENISLDYKLSDALQPLDEIKKKELIKDISSFANSAGGVIIYGVKESKDRIPVPESIDGGVDPNAISRERIEQIIVSNSRPRIDGLKITQVPLKKLRQGNVSYVIEVPQSTIAHQALDGRYYKRHCTTTEWMQHYEIMDVIGRTKTANVDINFGMIRTPDDTILSVALYVSIKNSGPKVVQNIFFVIGPIFEKIFNHVGVNFESYRTSQHEKEIVLYRNKVLFPTQEIKFISPTTEPLAFKDVPAWYEFPIPWKLYADDMNPKSGIIIMKDFLPPITNSL